MPKLQYRRRRARVDARLWVIQQLVQSRLSIGPGDVAE
jgi:hypothetical protein